MSDFKCPGSPDAARMVAAPRPHDWRWREREWTWVVASLVVVCAITAAWPTLDLVVAGWFFRPGDGFWIGNLRWVRFVYEAVPWIGRGLALLALLLWLTGRAGLGRPALAVRRRWALLGLGLLLGVGLVVNGVLKEWWGRARPVAVAEFGGPAHFSPALRPVRECRTNCSFVSGHAATGFVLGSVGLLGAPQTRRRWLCIGMTAGLGIGLLRMAQGAHFLSDVLFCGIVVWSCNLLVRHAALRWAARRQRRLSQARQRDGARQPTAVARDRAGGH